MYNIVKREDSLLSTAANVDVVHLVSLALFFPLFVWRIKLSVLSYKSKSPNRKLTTAVVLRLHDHYVGCSISSRTVLLTQ